MDHGYCLVCSELRTMTNSVLYIYKYRSLREKNLPRTHSSGVSSSRPEGWMILCMLEKSSQPLLKNYTTMTDDSSSVWSKQSPPTPQDFSLKCALLGIRADYNFILTILPAGRACTPQASNSRLPTPSPTPTSAPQAFPHPLPTSNTSPTPKPPLPPPHAQA